MGIFNNLPATPEPASDKKPAPVLLIVDDEAGPRESLRMVFKDRYQCVLATCGRDGIEYARTHPVDAAVLDIRMPDLSGIEVLRELKQHDPHIECVMLTGYETIETARAAVQHGAADYLNKPFDVFSMREVIGRCMERRQQHRHMQEQYQKLQTLNSELTRELADYARAATANHMGAGVIHELNNPLAIVSGYAQSLNRDLDAWRTGGQVSIEELQERVGRLQRELDRCKQLAQRFLRLARTGPAQSEPVEVAQLLQDSAALLLAHPDRKSTSVQYQAPEPPVRVAGQPSLLLQILLDLGINSLQAMAGQGSLRFSAQAASLPSQLAYRAPSLDPGRTFVALAVADTGPGIPPEVLPRIFTPQFTSKPAGNGLGLSIIAELVGRHHGAIAVHSQPQAGTTFTVFLPAAG